MKRMLLGLAVATFSFGQALPYEVVSVKRNDSGAAVARIGSTPDGRFSATNVTVEALLLNAFGILQVSHLKGAPAWTRTEHYDIEATPSERIPSTDRGQAQVFQRELIKAVLRDRFRLVVKQETQQVAIYVLTTGGPTKMKQSEDQRAIGPDEPRPTDGSLRRGGIRMGPGNLTARGVDMGRLALSLSGASGRPVEDHTGLTGLYDVDLKWTPDPSELPAGAQATPTADGASLFTAIREQLGLKLSSGTGPAQVVIVEKIERPGEN